MNAEALYKVSRDDFGGNQSGENAANRHPQRRAPASIGLWVFMGVVTSLFALFLMAYALRMDSPDWHRIALPWQVWLSTALLAAGSVAMAVASRAAGRGQMATARRALRLGGLGAAAFVASQLWAWQALGAMQVMPAGNPAGSFFYLLTAMHGLHVLGGLAGWCFAMSARGSGEAAVLRLRLCARYWHFLLAVWAVLLAALGWLTPELVRYICGTA
ncbi:bb3-type cytochrome oxidase subunit III [Cupriavidus taiwanensis]|uniref:bb3-type cytochrome oxidase subunit III n=1 Tax=Cupriavidus taiwanensis TaxID=164546 RepID=UPI000E105E0B|nr:bb3-type cytochrome oxidase subunit III [Cupriavidus taiwanensis]SOY67239.1 Cytochrome c oxidase subunit III [Cupriavidus taiwanensis]SOY67499.1 Cytochrome c oxidase subunit III [Cupriavidus taiwanensis]SOY94859.1 Cytochrome c oxidase subunit III [Cupriavidus taiwanensis]SOZ71809.1 Cytochrome c oxidase subunit III [Cupriavidus taiwanensis]SOZ87110.1 Cytochrome c oxidase subunit III [Cupriavidus taiwanensis]